MGSSKNTHVYYTDSARKDLKKINPSVARKITSKIQIKTQSSPLQTAQALRGIFLGLYRYRIGSYRAIFRFDERGKIYIVTILKIKHRKNIYK